MEDFCFNCPDNDVCMVDPEEFEDRCFFLNKSGMGVLGGDNQGTLGQDSRTRKRTPPTDLVQSSTQTPIYTVNTTEEKANKDG